MQDNNSTISQLKTVVAEFVNEREWKQFHNPKNIAMALSVEVAELMERLQWTSTEQSFDTYHEYKEHIDKEVADCFLLLLAFANACNIDISETFARKMQLNKQKYPVEKAKGIWDRNKM